MGNVLKAYRYRIVDNSAFEMPLPMKFTVLKADAPVAVYTVSENEQVTYDIITRYKELMITTIHRPLNISDIYYLFSCRVFQDRTPFTYPVLDRMGLEKYNVCQILHLTHGITPYDDYWLRFDGENITYDEAKEDFSQYLIGPELQPVPVVSYPFGAKPQAARQDNEADVRAILDQHKVNVDEIIADSSKPVSIAPDTSYEPEREVENNKMSAAEIDALLRSCGIEGGEDGFGSIGTGTAAPVEPLSRSEEPTEPSGGKLSQDEIEKLLAANAPKPEPTEPAPSGGKMSQDEIEKLLAANAPKPEPAEPAPEPAPSGGKLSQDEIEKLLAANAPKPEPAEPAPEPAPSGGKMSQEDIEKLLNSMQEEAAK